jgi:hypothetical protein
MVSSFIGAILPGPPIGQYPTRVIGGPNHAKALVTTDSISAEKSGKEVAEPGFPLVILFRLSRVRVFGKLSSPKGASTTRSVPGNRTRRSQAPTTGPCHLTLACGHVHRYSTFTSASSRHAQLRSGPIY